MAKEAKTTTVTAKLEYDGLDMTITKIVYDYEIESAIKDIATQVKVLSKGSTMSTGME
jgi:hypothetical protein